MMFLLTVHFIYEFLPVFVCVRVLVDVVVMLLHPHHTLHRFYTWKHYYNADKFVEIRCAGVVLIVNQKKSHSVPRVQPYNLCCS